MILPMEFILLLYECADDIEVRVGLRVAMKHHRFNPKGLLPPCPLLTQMKPIFDYPPYGTSVGFLKKLEDPNASSYRVGYIHIRYMPDDSEEYDDYVMYYYGWGCYEKIPLYQSVFR